jgi:hypothetical protein
MIASITADEVLLHIVSEDIEVRDAAVQMQYVAAEAALFDEIQREVSRKLEEGDRVPANWYRGHRQTRSSRI